MSKAKSAGALVAFMWFAYFLNYCDRQAVFSMFPLLKADLKMTDQELGLVGAMFLWVYAFGCPISGYLGDRFSKRLLVVLSLVVWSVVTIGTGLVASGAMLLAMRAAMGVSESLYMSSAVALTASAYPAARRSRAVSMLMTGQIAGTVVGSWFGGWMADRGQWREAFFALGAVGVLYALPYFAFLRRVEEPQTDKASTTAGITFTALARSRTFMLLCLVFPVFVFGIWLLYGWLPAFLHDKFSLNQADAAFNATAFLQAATFVGVISGGMIADALFHRTKAARFWLMVTGLALSAPCIHLLGNSNTLLVTRIAATGFGLFSGLFIANIFPAAFDVVSGDARATAVGVLNFFGAIMSGFATLFGGMWKQTLGIDRLLSITALAYLAVAVALIIGIRCLFPRSSHSESHVMKRTAALAIVALLAIGSDLLAQSAPPVAKPTPTHRVMLWPAGKAPIGGGKTEDCTKELEVFLPPADKANGAAIVLCPGGGYIRHVTDREGYPIAQWLNEHGIACIILEYRLPELRHQVPLLDAQRAIRLTRANAAAWKINPQRIGILGFSAGGHVASTALTHFNAGDAASADPIERLSCRPDFGWLVYPVVTMGEFTHTGSKEKLIGSNAAPDLVRLYSNETQVTADTPPTFLAHAIDDKPVPPENSRQFVAAMKLHNVPVELLELPSGGHGFNGCKGPLWEQWKAAALKWSVSQKVISSSNL